MIKFFRNIRQSMINQNRFTKYLLYAIGEIILVVIGILIALQVNNWAEEQQTKQKEIDYLQDIYVNLQQDSLSIESSKKYNLEKRAMMDTMMPLMSMDVKRKEFFSYIIDRMGVFTTFQVFQKTPTAFDNMMASEDINLISNRNLRIKLSRYYGEDELYGTQERIKLISREFGDILKIGMFNKEELDRNLNINSGVPTISETIDIRTTVNFYQKFFDLYMLLRGHNLYLDGRMRDIHTITTLIEAELEKRGEPILQNNFQY